ncbi:hypothetical protein BV22DRAFT_1051038 [Leucogyrophana mollusca]|uniref:Uncharacterized protein n=1 Tax=Leucogyrophana mollusca TaxID=85980 RepID=A0ACB8B3L3_9AGAM|nr:hypothetical protein BV22DRAFT_1051038 [Leucogyrophana mollusca]
MELDSSGRAPKLALRLVIERAILEWTNPSHNPHAATHSTLKKHDVYETFIAKNNGVLSVRRLSKSYVPLSVKVGSAMVLADHYGRLSGHFGDAMATYQWNAQLLVPVGAVSQRQWNVERRVLAGSALKDDIELYLTFRSIVWHHALRHQSDASVTPPGMVLKLKEVFGAASEQ